jgi:AraC-like DNA-binding protein
MSGNLKSSEQIQYRFILLYLILIGGIWVYSCIRFLPETLSFNAILIWIKVFIHLFYLFNILFLTFNVLRRLIPLYIISVTTLGFPNLLLSYTLDADRLYFCYQSYLWYIIIPLCTLVIYKPGQTLYWSAYIAVLILASYLIPQFLGDCRLNDCFGRFEYATFCLSNDIRLDLFTFFLLFMFILVHIMQYYSAKIEESRNQLGTAMPVTFAGLPRTPLKKEFTDEEQKYAELYERIVQYFETEKPYTDANYSVNQLAIALNTNASYIAKAIKAKRNMNYNTFVNTYRVNRVKELMAQESGAQLKLQYIYSASGFKSQVTFNRVFKSVEGLTPSEYFKGKNL